MTTRLARSTTSTDLLARLLERPNLVREVRELPPERFSALVRQVGLEDAGELVELATTDQLVNAFDEDLFANERPGEREVFDSERFTLWLEVLLEAGEAAAARRVTQLSEDFMVRALSSLLLVLDYDALLLRMGEAGEDGARVDKALESSLTEDIDGYLLVARQPEGWDAVLALILALDREHRALLERLLDRCARLAGSVLDDLDALAGVLDATESLAEDVEAEREERRSARGYVEPRAARNFLELARRSELQEDCTQRDPVTQAYFRDLDRSRKALGGTSGLRRGSDLDAITALAGPAEASAKSLPSEQAQPSTRGAVQALSHAMSALSESDPILFDQRMEELAFLANVLLSGGEKEGARFEPAEAAEAALATVRVGVELAVAEARERKAADSATEDEVLRVLRVHSADSLFRKASRTLVSLSSPAYGSGIVYRAADVSQVLEHVRRSKLSSGCVPESG